MEPTGRARIEKVIADAEWLIKFNEKALFIFDTVKRNGQCRLLLPQRRVSLLTADVVNPSLPPTLLRRDELVYRPDLLALKSDDFLVSGICAWLLRHASAFWPDVR